MASPAGEGGEDSTYSPVYATRVHEWQWVDATAVPPPVSTTSTVYSARAVAAHFAPVPAMLSRGACTHTTATDATPRPRPRGMVSSTAGPSASRTLSPEAVGRVVSSPFTPCLQHPHSPPQLQAPSPQQQRAPSSPAGTPAHATSPEAAVDGGASASASASPMSPAEARAWLGSGAVPRTAQPVYRVQSAPSLSPPRAGRAYATPQRGHAARYTDASTQTPHGDPTPGSSSRAGSTTAPTESGATPAHARVDVDDLLGNDPATAVPLHLRLPPTLHAQLRDDPTVSTHEAIADDGRLLLSLMSPASRARGLSLLDDAVGGRAILVVDGAVDFVSRPDAYASEAQTRPTTAADATRTSTTAPLAQGSTRDPQPTPVAIADTIYKAMKGFGTDEDAIYTQLGGVTSQGMWEDVKDAFRGRHGGFHQGDVVAALKDELTGKEYAKAEAVLKRNGVRMCAEEATVYALPSTILSEPSLQPGVRASAVATPVVLQAPQADPVTIADTLYAAMKGFGTDEDAIYRQLGGVTSQDMWEDVKDTFRAKHTKFHKGDVVAALEDELTRKEYAKAEGVLWGNGVRMCAEEDTVHALPSTILSEPSLQPAGSVSNVATLYASQAAQVASEAQGSPPPRPAGAGPRDTLTPSDLAADPVAIADTIYKAMKGFGTDEDAIYTQLGGVTSQGMWEDVKDAFRERHGGFHQGDVVAALKDELTGKEYAKAEGVLRGNGVRMDDVQQVQPSTILSEPSLQPAPSASNIVTPPVSQAAPHDVVTPEHRPSQPPPQRTSRPAGRGTLTPYDLAVAVADTIHKAMKGFGTDEDAIYTQLGGVTSQGMWEDVKDAFRTRHGGFHEGDVVAALRDELTKKELTRAEGVLRGNGVRMCDEVVGASVMSASLGSLPVLPTIMPDAPVQAKAHTAGPPAAVADTLHKAMKGFGTDEDAIYTQLGGVTSQGMWEDVKDAFRGRHGGFHHGDVVAALKDELTGKEYAKAEAVLKRNGVVLDAPRASGDVSEGRAGPVRADPCGIADALHKAMKGFGTDEDAIYTQLGGVTSQGMWEDVKDAFRGRHGGFYKGDVVAALKDELTGKEFRRAEGVLRDHGVLMEGAEPLLQPPSVVPVASDASAVSSVIDGLFGHMAAGRASVARDEQQQQQLWNTASAVLARGSFVSNPDAYVPGAASVVPTTRSSNASAVRRQPPPPLRGPLVSRPDAYVSAGRSSRTNTTQAGRAPAALRAVSGGMSTTAAAARVVSHPDAYVSVAASADAPPPVATPDDAVATPAHIDREFSAMSAQVPGLRMPSGALLSEAFPQVPPVSPASQLVRSPSEAAGIGKGLSWHPRAHPSAAPPPLPTAIQPQDPGHQSSRAVSTRAPSPTQDVDHITRGASAGRVSGAHSQAHPHSSAVPSVPITHTVTSVGGADPSIPATATTGARSIGSITATTSIIRSVRARPVSSNGALPRSVGTVPRVLSLIDPGAPGDGSAVRSFHTPHSNAK